MFKTPKSNKAVFLSYTLLLILLVIFQSHQTLAAYNPYGVFGLYSRGSGRSMAMGGTFAALSDNATAVIGNPAGPVLEKWSFDAGAASNRFDNQELQPLGSGANYSPTYVAPFSYTAYAAAARLGWLAIGLGYSNPFEFTYDSNSSLVSPLIQFGASVKISSYDASLAVRFGDYFSVGVGGHALTLEESFQKSTSAKASTQSTGTAYSMGAAYKEKKFGLGVVYTPSTKILVDSSNNAAPYASYSWFRDVVIPSLTVFGGFYRFNDRFMIAADLNQYDVPVNSVDLVSGFNNGTASSDTMLYSGNMQIIRGGFEWLLATDKNFELIFRGGGYQEPARIVRNESRFHRTFGLQVRFGPVLLNVAFDQANNFSSTSQGFSFVVGAL